MDKGNTVVEKDVILLLIIRSIIRWSYIDLDWLYFKRDVIIQSSKKISHIFNFAKIKIEILFKTN